MGYGYEYNMDEGDKDNMDDRKTTVGSINPAMSERVTRVMPTDQVRSAPEESHMAGKGDSRQMVGLLVTYSMNPSGELYPVREGKNFIGSGKISSDASHRDCDVLVSQDERISGEHALILCRHGVYEIIDQTSSNGTFLDNAMLPANQSRELKNYAEIRAGSTVFTFIKITAPEGTSQTISAPKKVEQPSEPPDTTDPNKTRVR